MFLQLFSQPQLSISIAVVVSLFFWSTLYKARERIRTNDALLRIGFRRSGACVARFLSLSLLQLSLSFAVVIFARRLTTTTKSFFM